MDDLHTSPLGHTQRLTESPSQGGEDTHRYQGQRRRR